MTRHRTLLGTTALLGGGLLVARLGLTLLGDPLLTAARSWDAGTATFEVLLTGTCAVLLAGCLTWLLLGTALAVVSEVLTGLGLRSGRLHRLAEAVSPRVVRVLVGALLGAAVAAGSAAPALADPGPAAPAADLSGLPVPDRTVGAGPAVPSRAPTARPTALVRPGDSLWSITADLLPGATDRETAAAVDRLYAANRGRIGPDPDLIQPGTTLRLPHGVRTRTTSDREDPS